MMSNELIEIIELTKSGEFQTTITYEQVIEARDIINEVPESTEHLFLILCSMNLINAAIKTKQFKEIIYYGMLKPKVSKLLIAIIDKNKEELNVDFYIDEFKQCTYIEICGLQFGFHNLTIYSRLKEYINSPMNQEVEWKGVRLQKIAGELFEYAINNHPKKRIDL